LAFNLNNVSRTICEIFRVKNGVTLKMGVGSFTENGAIR